MLEKVLIIYGSLAPGEKNHHIISHIKGSWHKATIQGRIIDNGWSDNRSGYPEFQKVENGEAANTLSVMAFISSELDAHWKLLDDFEASENYSRVRISCKLENGEQKDAFIYECSKPIK